MPTSAIRGNVSGPGVIGALKGICLGGPTSILGDGTFGRHLQVGVLRSDAEGNPGTPSLELAIPGMWRFRWAVKSGTRSLGINVKQAANLAPYPSVIIRANPAIGVAADVTGTSPGGTGWVNVGPVVVTPSSTGVLWVELWNNCTRLFNTPAYFDHLTLA